MTAPLGLDRDRTAVDALIADRYLDALLAAADRRADDAPADALLDPELRRAVRILRRSLVRSHPSFRFEERLAARLADLAADRAGRVAVGGSVVPFARSNRSVGASDPLLDAILAGGLDPAELADPDLARDGEPWVADPPLPSTAPRRPWLVGGALTSAAISLAGVAFVAWRSTRAPGRPPVA